MNSRDFWSSWDTYTNFLDTADLSEIGNGKAVTNFLDVPWWKNVKNHWFYKDTT